VNHDTEMIEVKSQRIQELLQRAASNTLCDDDMKLMRQILRSYQRLFQIVGDKNGCSPSQDDVWCDNREIKNVLDDVAGDAASGEVQGDSDAEGCEDDDPDA